MEFGPFCERIGLKLEPFQRRIAKAAAGREREFVCLIPRGSGKTTLLAAFALHHLIETEDAQVCVAASSRQQATILFEAAVRFALRLEDEHVVTDLWNCAGARTRTSPNASAASCAFSLPMRRSCTGSAARS